MTSAPVATMHEKVHHDTAQQQGGNQASAREDMKTVLKTVQYCRNRQKDDKCYPGPRFPETRRLYRSVL